MRNILFAILAIVAPVAFAQGETVISDQATPEGVAEVTWNLTNEQFVTEFRIFRGDTREGPWSQIISIPGLGPGIHGPQSYRHLDEGLVIGTSYNYLVECEFTDGEIMRTPPISFVANQTASPEAQAISSE